LTVYTSTSNTGSIDIDVTNRNSLTLTVTSSDGSCGDHADWAGARLLSGTAAVDSDGDGVVDSNDAFPNDPSETTDTDGDGVGDNADAFPTDPTRTDINPTIDTDGDGVPDVNDAFPNDDSETVDTDGDGVGDNADLYPNDPTRIVDDLTYISDMVWVSEVNGWGPAERDRSNGEFGATDGNTLLLNGVSYTKGIGIHAESTIVVDLSGQYSRFIADIGIDDERVDGACGSVQFLVEADGENIYTSTVYTSTSDTGSIDIDVSNKDSLALIATSSDGSCGDHADWANAHLLAAILVDPTLDTDGDGMPDINDAFPNDASETMDTDSDGVGDNADDFPNDDTETIDTDGDGVGDNADAFPSDPTRTEVDPNVDTDGDGVPDINDAFPNDPTRSEFSVITELPVLPRNSSTLIVESSTGADRIWNVNPDNNSVSVSSSDGALLQEITVGNTPWSLAKSTSSDQVYVTNKGEATLSIINTQTLTLEQTVNLPANSQPHVW